MKIKKNKDGVTILVVCSEKKTASDLTSLFHFHHWEAQHAIGGFQALSLIEKIPYNAILINDFLYDMVSTELISLIRSANPSEAVMPIIVFGEKDLSPEDSGDFKIAGATTYVPLVEDKNLLVKTLVKLLAERM